MCTSPIKRLRSASKICLKRLKSSVRAAVFGLCLEALGLAELKFLAATVLVVTGLLPAADDLREVALRAPFAATGAATRVAARLVPRLAAFFLVDLPATGLPFAAARLLAFAEAAAGLETIFLAFALVVVPGLAFTLLVARPLAVAGRFLVDRLLAEAAGFFWVVFFLGLKELIQST